MQGGDGFHCKVDPSDPNIVYGCLQYGVLCRFDRRTGERVQIQPQPAAGEPTPRWNWDSPLMISPHNPRRIYFAANRLFRSDDRGDSWKPISDDLTRQIDRNKLAVMGKVWGPDAIFKHSSTSLYGNCVALAESPKKEGLIYVGTDDGLIQITEDGGKTWRKVDTVPRRAREHLCQQAGRVAARREHRLRLLRQSQERRLRALSPQEHRRRPRPGRASPATCRSAALSTASRRTTSIRICCSPARSSGCSSPSMAARNGTASRTGCPPSR